MKSNYKEIKSDKDHELYLNAVILWHDALLAFCKDVGHEFTYICYTRGEPPFDPECEGIVLVRYK